MFSQRRAGAQQGAVDGRTLLSALQQLPAASFADQPSTSRRIRTARCRGGRRRAAIRSASSTVSFETTAVGRCVRCGDRLEDTVGVRRVRMPSHCAAGAHGRSATRWSRSHRARSETRSARESSRACPRRAGTSPAPGPRRPRASRGSGTHVPGSLAGAGRRAGRTRSRRLPWPRRRSGRLLWSTCGRRYGRPAGGRLGELTESASLNLSGVRCGGRIGQGTR